MPHSPPFSLSIIVPAKNEENAVGGVVKAARELYPDAEIIVVDDGSTDDTSGQAERAGARLIRHPYSKGNGAAIKSGVRAAEGEVIVLLDGDGQHNANDIPRLLERIEKGYELAIGTRGADSQANVLRLLGNWAYNRLASWLVGHRVEDLTSGFRAAVTARFREFLPLLPNGFSSPTTSTMAFFRSGYSVAFVPVEMGSRQGKSHIRVVHDGARFLLIIFRIGALYSPLKIFAPISLILFLMGSAYYAYTYLTFGRFTNMAALLLTSSVLIFLIGLVSEQITQLLYSRQNLK